MTILSGRRARARSVSEKGRWEALWEMAYREGDIDEYRARRGKEEGEARFFRDVRPHRVIVRKGNLLLYGGVSCLWESLIGNGTGTAAQTLTYFNNGNAYMAFCDGSPTVLAGTSAITTGSPNVVGTGTSYGSGLVGNYVVFSGDATVYKVLTYTDASHIVLTSNAVTTNSSATATTYTAEVATQTDLQAGSNKVRKAMDATYPQHTDATTSGAASIIWQGTLGSSDGNWTTGIFEVGVANASTGGRLLNRKVTNLGVKTAGNTASGKLTVTIS